MSTYAAASSGPPITENAYCDKGNVAKFGDKDGPAELPKTCYYTGLDGTPSPGKEVRVPANANLSDAVEKAKCGETLLLPAGASYEIKQLPKKHCDDQHYITIRTDTPDSKLPPEGTRITPAWQGVASLTGRPAYAQPAGGPAKLMATILVHAVTGTMLSDHLRFIGIEWSSSPEAKTTRMINTDGANHVIFDRNWFHPAEGAEMAKGVLFDGDTQYVAVVNSYFSNFNCIALRGSCTDASAVGGGLAHGDAKISTLKVYNNYLEASGENILFGGGGSDTNPVDIEIRRNHLFKPMIWKRDEPGYTPSPAGTPYIVKNHFELKTGIRVLFEANLLENSWGGFTQKGLSILLTPKSQSGNCPKCRVEDVTVRYNRIRNVAGGFEIVTGLAKGGAESSGGGRWMIHDLIMDEVHNTGWVGVGAFANIASRQPMLHDVVFDHITAFVTGPIFQVESPENKIPGFRVTNSIFTTGGRRPGIVSAGGGQKNCAGRAQRFGDKAVLEECFDNPVIQKNLVIGGRGWPSGNFSASSVEGAGLRPLDNNGISTNPHLCRGKEAGCSKPSPGIGVGTDGKDIGADVDGIDAALAGVE